MTTRVKKAHPEHDMQVCFIKWCRLSEQAHPELKLLFAIPNGGYRSPVTGAMLKAEGVRAGVPDLGLPISRNGYNGLWIEFKHGKNKPTPAQAEYMALLKANGHAVYVCYSWHAAMDIVKLYLL